MEAKSSHISQRIQVNTRIKTLRSKNRLACLGRCQQGQFSCPVYSILHQSSGISQGLLCLKPQLSKQDLTIPRLELVACHMSVNLIDNAKKALTGHPVGQLVPCADGSAALYWIRGNSNYKQFLKNRVDKIREKKKIAWLYVNNTENAADIGSRDMSVTKISNNWPSDMKKKATAETEKEARIMKNMMTSTTLKSDVMDEILQRYSHWKFFRISSWMQRFLHNCNTLKLERQ